MKHLRFMFACLTMLFMISGMFSVALADYNLLLQATSDGSTVKAEFQRGDNLYLNILLDDPTDVAGCAFTLNYPAGVLAAPATSGEGTPVTPGEIVSSFPFTYESTDTHRENSSEPGKLYFSGAAIDTTTGGGIYNSAGEIVLFTVKFIVKNDAPLGDFQFSLTQTELWDLEAGYGTDNNGNGEYDPGVDEKGIVSVLVGAVDNQDPNWDDLCEAFPVLLGDSLHPFTPAAVPFTITRYTAAKIRLEADPSHVSSVTPSESALIATILDANDNVVSSGPDSTLAVIFAVTDTTYGDIKAGETNPVNAVNGSATIVIVSKVHVTGGDIPCTADATGAQGQGALVQGTATVTTGPSPTVTTGAATSIATTTATLNGTVNPNGISTSYHFEYGPDMSYGTSTTPGDAGSGTSDVSVSADLAELTPGATYHFRLVATNSAGPTNGGDETFTTEHDQGNGGGSCFIGAAASGLFLGYYTTIHITFVQKMLLVFLVLMLAAGGCMVLRRLKMKRVHEAP